MVKASSIVTSIAMIVTLSGIFAIPIKSQAATLKYQNDFENGWGDVMFRGFCKKTNDYEITLNVSRGDVVPAGHDQFMRTTQYARSGKYSARTILDPKYACIGDDTGLLKIRSEIAMGNDWNTIYRFTDNTEHWYGVSMMMDPNNSLKNPPRAITIQMKQPGTSNSVSNEGGRWEYFYETERGGGGVKADLGPIEKGKWTDFVIRIRPSVSNLGYVEIWVNGIKKYSKIGTPIILTDRGGQSANVVTGVYYGQYGENFSTYGNANLPFILYLDSVKIAQGSDGYSLVAPSGTSSSEPPAPTPPTTPSTCNRLSSSVEVPTGFGASFNLFSVAKEYLLSGNCGSTSVTMTVGNNEQTTYAYNKGYHWNGTNWTPYTLSCSGQTISGVWCQGKGTASIPISSVPPTSVIGYTCQWSGSKWNCGCRDSSCQTSYWQLQLFEK